MKKILRGSLRKKKLLHKSKYGTVPMIIRILNLNNVKDRCDNYASVYCLVSLNAIFCSFYGCCLQKFYDLSVRWWVLPCFIIPTPPGRGNQAGTANTAFYLDRMA
jgi:hypothetical protein